MAVYKIGDRVTITSYGNKSKGTVKGWKGKRLLVLQDSTTTGAISEYSWRKNNYGGSDILVMVGFTIDEADHMGYIHATKTISKKPMKKPSSKGKRKTSKNIKVGGKKISRLKLIDSMWNDIAKRFIKNNTYAETMTVNNEDNAKQIVEDFEKSSFTKHFRVRQNFLNTKQVTVKRRTENEYWNYN